jgi:hypothetical protein
LEAALTNAIPKKYIPEWCKLDFFNDSNLKTDIQNRISVSTATNFINALQDMKGDNRNGGGFLFSEITLLAMAYFYSEIFTGKLTDRMYSLDMVKGYLDADNMTDYTAIHEIDVCFYKLDKAPYFKQCWLIIQSAWFFNSEHFGHHQFIDFLNHYITNGDKLPIECYKYDKNYLEKKYNDIDEAKFEQFPINGFALVSKWYFGILFLICKELNLPTTHFMIKNKDNREYNPLTKMSRQLRPLMPFKIIECDIKSAFPTFLDALTGAKLKDDVYNNLMKSKSISRSGAKIMYNKICNSKEYKTKHFTAEFFISCGYSEEHLTMLLYFTHNDHLKFFQFMTRREERAINAFVTQNSLKRGARLHDAVIFLDTKEKIGSYNLKVIPNCEFGFKELNRPVYKESFSLSNKQLPYAYMNSIPKGLNLISKLDGLKPTIIGDVNGFRYYSGKYEYISASFNVNNYNINYTTFNNQCAAMFSTLRFLNQQVTNPKHVYVILRHIRESSNIVFNVRAMYFKTVKLQYDETLVKIKTRDFDLIENLKFRRKIDFLNALNTSRGIVNCNYNLMELYCLLEERLLNDDYGFLNELAVKGLKKNNILLCFIIRKFNLLCTGLLRTPRKQVKKEALYDTPIKSLPVNLFSSNRTLKATLIRQQKKKDREQEEDYRLINNRSIAQQLFLILSQVVNQESVLIIPREILVQKQLKYELISAIDKTDYSDIDIAVSEFDKRYCHQKNQVQEVSVLNNIFDENLGNSIFNQISFEEACSRDDIFFMEFLRFHNIEEEKEIVSYTEKRNIYKNSQLDFEF